MTERKRWSIENINVWFHFQVRSKLEVGVTRADVQPLISDTLSGLKLEKEIPKMEEKEIPKMEKKEV